MDFEVCDSLPRAVFMFWEFLIPEHGLQPFIDMRNLILCYIRDCECKCRNALNEIVNFVLKIKESLFSEKG